MAKDNTILWVAAIGIGGYFLYKSDFFKGLGQITGGAGQAAQGLGEGISTAAGGLGSGIGMIGTSAGMATENIAQFLEPLGALGEAVSRNIQDISDIQRSIRQREAGQSTEVDVAAFDATKGQLADIQAGKDVFSAEQGALRSKDIQETKTRLQDFATDIIDPKTYATAASTTLKAFQYNPFNVITQWVTSQASAVLKKSSSSSSQQILAPTMSTSGGSSAISSTSGSSGSIRYSSFNASTDKLMTTLGYVGMSTSGGVVYTKPTPTIQSILKTTSTSSSVRAPAKKNIIQTIGGFFGKIF